MHFLSLLYSLFVFSLPSCCELSRSVPLAVQPGGQKVLGVRRLFFFFLPRDCLENVSKN